MTKTTRATITADVIVTHPRDVNDFAESLYDAVIGEGSLDVDVVEVSKITHEIVDSDNLDK